MINFRPCLVLLASALLSCNAEVNFPCGLLMPTGEEEIGLPLRSMKISVNVVDGIAEVAINQAFETGNSTGHSHYQLPIDANAAVTKFAAVIDKRIVRAVVKDKEVARQDYEEALEAGKGAYLAEQQRRDIFKISVGNLPTQKIVQIEIMYVVPLEAVGVDTVAFFLPTGISPRYEPSEMLQDGIAYYTNLMDKGVTIEMNATMAGPVQSVTSPSHSIAVTSDSDLDKGSANVVVTDEDPLVRDLTIYIKTENNFSPKLFIEHSELYSSTAMLLSFVPPAMSENSPRNYEFIFVVDRSGSMMGDKISQMCKSLRRIIETLPTGSIFNIVGFGSDVEFLFDKSQYVSSSVSFNAALEHVDTMGADMGGTEILTPLKRINSNKRIEGFYRQIFVFTDGDVSNTQETIQFVRTFGSHTRVFSLGIGAHASRALVQGIARNGRGTAEFVEGDDDESIYEAVERQMKVAFSPAFDDVQIEWGMAGEQAPYITPPLLQEKRYLAYYLVDGLSSSEAGAGYLQNNNNMVVSTSDLSIKISASDVTSGKDYEFKVMTEDIIYTKGLYNGNMIHKMSAKGRILDLEDGGSKLHSDIVFDEDEVAKKIVEIGVKYQLSSSKTSFIAVDNYNWTAEADLDDLLSDDSLYDLPSTSSRNRGITTGSSSSTLTSCLSFIIPFIFGIMII
eukprot:CAMPEP_0194335090 /NCGR_PEP_ID=MMETSP0171-20130528/68327_1 /TAXON_ID=218684 /ORGANISM="Corethron pennatum, Strain L29A3" /LENGTH=675 /DNA_ID=CAMNT_0039098015 /DNA_START=60 /DNA_END=2087 /DNA_ORIENTATION=+